MTDVQKGAPPPTNRTKFQAFNNTVLEMIEAAAADRGEWYSIPIPAEHMTKNWQAGLSVKVAGFIGRHLADVSTRDGRVWIRIKP